jgi:hypothetical protein
MEVIVHLVSIAFALAAFGATPLLAQAAPDPKVSAAKRADGAGSTGAPTRQSGGGPGQRATTD